MSALPRAAHAPAQPSVRPIDRADLVAESVILRSGVQNKGLEAIPAANPNQMNRLIGELDDGRRVVIAQRHGRGGMEFTKIMGGKVLAVAADAFAPVYEKDKNGKATSTQKTENGLPLFSSSGFYLLSSRDYPALLMKKCFARLRAKGEEALLLDAEALDNPQTLVLLGEESLDDLADTLADMLDDKHNLVARFDDGINAKRKRALTRAREDAEADGVEFAGPEFKEASVSVKDGNPFCLCAWKSDTGESGVMYVLRQREGSTDAGLPRTEYLTAKDAVEHAKKTSRQYAAMRRALLSGAMVQVAVARGHVMRTSVSFKKKVALALALPADKPKYGDAPFVLGALSGWCLAILSVMHSQHPGFPLADYDSHHYVAALRQAEIGMNKKQDGSGWLPPQPVHYAVEDGLRAKL